MRPSPRAGNVFYSFRGASAQSRGDDADVTEPSQRAQLEDNVTKALVNTLQHTHVAVRDRFLELVGVPNARSSCADRGVNYFLQRAPHGDDAVFRKRHRVLLGIVPHGETGKRVVGTRASRTGARRPDAWIAGPDFSVLVEVKISGALDADQWADHHATLLAGTTDPVTTRELSWKEVYDALSSARDEFGVDRSRWILDQFLEYLRLENIVGYTGITTEVFDYFFDPGDPDTRSSVKRTWSALADALQPELGQVNPWYAGHEVGNLKGSDAHCWVAFGPMDSGNGGSPPYRQHAHLTASIRSTGIEFFANIELKSAIDRLRAAITGRRSELLDALRGLRGRGYEIRIEERQQRQASIYDYVPVSSVRVEYLFNDNVGAIATETLFHSIAALPLPSVMIVKSIGRQDVVGCSPSELVTKLRGAAAELDQIVRVINGTR